MENIFNGFTRFKAYGLNYERMLGREITHLSMPAKMKVLVTQSYAMSFNPMDCSPPGFSVHGILQARILKWIAIPFSRASSPPRG